MRRLWPALVPCIVLAACGGGGSSSGGGPTPVSSRVLYVRAAGDDANRGTTPDQALKTVAHAAQILKPGVTVYVGPGRYVGRVDIGSIHGTHSAPVQLIADPNGAHTGDEPGDVILDASGDIFALRLSTATNLSVDGFMITGAAPSGSTTATQIEVRSSSTNAAIRNCVIIDGGPADGVRVQDSAGVLLFDNLIVNNGRGVLVSGKAANADLVNNTIMNNGATGVTFKETGKDAPTGGMLRNNIIQDSGSNINISVSAGPPSSLSRYVGDFNLVFLSGVTDQTKGYRPVAIRGDNDVNADAMFVDAVHGDYHLAPNSPAVDAGSPAIDATLLHELLERSTSADAGQDKAPADLGYHYPAGK